MENYLTSILGNALFDDISIKNLNMLLHCLDANKKKYRKNEFILHEGAIIDFIGIVISGSVKVVKNDCKGNQVIIAIISEGDIFGEVFVCSEVVHSPISVLTAKESDVLIINHHKLIHTCSMTCEFQNKLIFNMLKIISRKNLYLNQKIDIISRRTLRDKIFAYLSYVSHGSNKFKIDLNREELAEFLCVDRSALSNELSKMQKEGLIKFCKNEFELLVGLNHH